MLEQWGLELLKGIGKLFLNPLLYWTFFLLSIIGYRRIKSERYNFGTKIYHYFAEIKHTALLTIVTSIIISTVAILFGLVLSYEVMIVLIVVMIICSLFGSLHFLSASYTVGLTFILLLILPFLQPYIANPYIDFTKVSMVEYVGLTAILGLLLFVEALLISFTKNERTFPTLHRSERGVWVGQHHFKRMMLVPFFVFVPANIVTSVLPFYPYFEFGEQTFSLVLFPFIIGYQYRTQSSLPIYALRHVGRGMYGLAILILIGVGISLFYPFVSFITIVVALIGKEWIMYRHKARDRKASPLFTPLDKGIKVFAMIPNGPAERLGIEIGETILKVNNIIVTDSFQFYKALQTSNTNFKLDVLDDNGEVRFIQSTFFAEDHYELGLLFTEQPHRYKEK